MTFRYSITSSISAFPWWVRPFRFFLPVWYVQHRGASVTTILGPVMWWRAAQFIRRRRAAMAAL